MNKNKVINLLRDIPLFKMEYVSISHYYVISGYVDAQCGVPIGFVAPVHPVLKSATGLD